MTTMSGSRIPSVLCVHAHPDDEALFTGGVLARTAAAGGRTAVVTCTWREGDERVEELRESLNVLGAGEARLLGYTDFAFDDGVRFCSAPLDEVVGKLVAHIREFRPDVVVTYDAFGTYGHPDHIHAHRITLAAVEAAGCAQLFPEAGNAWSTQHLCFATFPRTAIEATWKTLFGADAPSPGPGVPGVPDEQVSFEVDVVPWYDAKWTAFSAHRTELKRGGGASRFAALSEIDRRKALGTEWFIHRRIDGSVGTGVDPFLPREN